MATTRVVHRVRCRSKQDSSVWADVKVLDAIVVFPPGPNSTPYMLWTRAKDAKVCIVDKTGDGNGKGSASDCDRLSHMERVESQDDPAQKFDIEVLDMNTFKPPPLIRSNEVGPTDGNEDHHGNTEGALFGKGPYALKMLDKDSVKYTVDKVGLGLGEGNPGSASRSGHVNLVTEKGNTDSKTDGISAAGDSIPPQTMAWLATVRVDAMNFKVGFNNLLFYVPPSLQDEQDTTKLVEDPDTHEMVPPDNTDPNIYVAFPDGTDGGAPTVGLDVHIPQNVTTGKVGAINQGILWWIDRISPSFNPWFWFATVQEPQAFSFFGAPGSLGSWAWRGFVLWNNYPVIWILSANNALAPMGDFGSPSLELCAEQGNFDNAFPPVPSSEFLAAPRPVGSTVNLPFTALSLAGITGIEESTDVQTFAPFGVLQMTSPPLGPLSAGKVPYGTMAFGADGSQLWDGLPNIWQLTGLDQPKRQKPDQPWDVFTNRYNPPTSKQAKEAAQKFRDNWNAVANGHNDFIKQYVPGGGVANGGPSYDQPPGWKWAIPWFDGFIGPNDPGFPPEGYHESFQNGIPPGVATHALPLEVYAPATAWVMEVDQLDPAKWDTTHFEINKNPLNWFSPFVQPPFPWDHDPWTGSGGAHF